MAWAHVVAGEIVAVTPRCPRRERDAGVWWDLADPAVRVARGWLEVVVAAPPESTFTETYDPAPPALVDGVPTQQWAVRPWADGELRARAEATTEAVLHDRARAALARNGTWLGRAGAPTNADVLAHVDLLTRECSALIRLATRALGTIEGT